MTRNPFAKASLHRGAALLLFVVLFMVSSLVLVLAVGSSAYHARATYRSLLTSKVGFYAAEAGIEDAIYRHNNGYNYDNAETFSIDGADVTMSRSTGIDRLRLTAAANAGGASRTSYLELLIGEGVAFNFGLQSGTGGIRMENNSKIRGNVFSNGTVEGQGSATVFGNIVSAGPTGRIETTYATGSAWAHTITGSVIDKDAYYTTIIGTTVGGASYSGSPDEDPVPLPIEDSTIEGWKDNIENTGTVIASTSPQCAGGTYVINTDTILGNVKIDCNVEMRKQGAATTITITDDVWISGNLSFSQGPSIIASSTDISNSIAVIVDKESNQLTSSKISVNQSTNFTGINASTYLLLISMNDSSENGGSEIAIDLAQSANGKVLVYASHGLVDMGNSISLKEVTAHQIEVSNGAEVVYESGIMSLLFDSGPGGGFTLLGGGRLNRGEVIPYVWYTICTMKPYIPLVMGNWKMNPQSTSLSSKLTTQLKKTLSKYEHAEVVIAPPVIHLDAVSRARNGSKHFSLGVQNVHTAQLGAYTGEISLTMLKEFSVTHCIIGHSERRREGETDEMVNAKLAAVVKAGLTGVVCVGETTRDQNGQYLSHVELQIRAALAKLSKAKLGQVVIAYEPIWAIGTGVNATPADVYEMKLFIEKVLTELYGRNMAQKVRIIYGGSVNPKNARELFVEGMVAGFLVGGASLHADDFTQIVKATA